MGKGRIRVEERIKAETDAKMQKETLLDQTQTKKGK
ncbi:YhdX family protein [Bacillus sp. FJAT-27445]|nr:YhdX family protein [Bacillus sp. FJAT-27445]